MSEQTPYESGQDFGISGDASLENVQIGGIAKRDLTSIQVQNLTVYDSIDLAGLFKPSSPVPSTSLTRQEYRQRKVLLNKVKNFWVEGVLEKSLHTRVVIELGLEERPNAIQPPFSGVEEFTEETARPLPSGTSARMVLAEMDEGGTLLILGNPGSGKTTTLLKLAQSIIAQTEEDLSRPIPVVFNLSSWSRQHRTLADWLVKELNSKYQVSKILGNTWLENQELLLLLDGLDEVKAENREACVQAINEFIRTHGQTEIVVCCRIQDYEVLPSQLQVQRAICLKSLTQKQIEQYLDRAGGQLQTVKLLLQDDTALQELAKSPLVLSVMTLAYQGASTEDLPRQASIEERRQHLLDTYIERMFRRKGAKQKYTKVQVLRYLTWLAKQLRQNSQTIFLIERMQPTWLPHDQRTNYRVGNVINFVLAARLASLVFGYIPQIFGFGMYHRLITPSLNLFLINIVFNFATGLIFFGFTRGEIRTLETIKSPFEFDKFVGFIVGNFNKSKLCRSLKKIFFRLLICGLISGVCYSLFLGIIWFIDPSMVKDSSPLEGMKLGVITGLFYGSLTGLISGILGYYGTLTSLSISLIWGLFFLLSEEMVNFWNNIPSFQSYSMGLILFYILFTGYLFGLICGFFVRFGKQYSIIFGLLMAFSLGLFFWHYEDYFIQKLEIYPGRIPALWVYLNTGWFFGIILGLIFYWTFALQGPEIERKIKPNQGIWRSATNAVFIGLIFSIVWVTFAAWQFWGDSQFYQQIFVSLYMGMFFGLLSKGGQACIRHFTLRLLLYRKGYIPWNYARFLDYATERIFLQKVGGGYIFVHRMLMEHFARLELK